MKDKPLMVQPIHASGLNMSLAQLFGSGPKWTITCGHCYCTFKKRIPMTDDPGITCPTCNVVNILNIQVT